ncbi:MAG TPA: phosphoenolpyruvate-utilizing N-terminal domain-containing protein, partial [Acetobacteraceae bacterium]|nr:phosphoenolpyruvate-utilizing N-terminal domain-containing protein [Acetobacteraceae bacterium]
MNKAEPPPPQHKRLSARLRVSERPEAVLSGIPASPGIAIGQVFTASEPTPEITRFHIDAGALPAEMARLDAAIAKSRRQLRKLQARLAALPEESQAELAPLIEAYLRMLSDSRLLRGARRRMGEGLRSAESAVAEEAEVIAGAMMAQATPGMVAEDCASLQRRADEVREIARRLVRNLTNAPFRSFTGLPEGAILVAENLRPADAALLDPARLAGVGTAEGGAEGHTAVMLRALGVPAVLGVPGLTHAIRPGDMAII